MPVFYTLNRLGTLNPAAVISLVKYQDIDPPELQLHVDNMFPNGVSYLGERYFLREAPLVELKEGDVEGKVDAANYPRLTEPAIELIFEYVSRAKFPERPSRFQSVFGFESLAQVIEFRSKYGSGQGVIWEIESEKYFRADITC